MGVWLVAQGHDTIIRNIEVQSAVSINVGQRQRHPGAPQVEPLILSGLAKVPLSIVEKNVSAACDRVHDQVKISVPVKIRKSAAARVEICATDACLRGGVFKAPITQVSK